MPLHQSKPILYLITRGATTEATTANDPSFAEILNQVSAAVTAGIDLIQIREKQLTAEVLFKLAAAAASLTRKTATQLLVNDRADIAAGAGADGVHLTTQSLDAEVIRRTFGAGFLIGASTHSLDEVRAARDHADFVVSCGKGTYIRSLGRDLAQALGTVGHLSALRRTAVGPFREESAISLPKLEALGHIPPLLGVLVPVATALDDIPALALTEAQADRLRQGQPVLLTRDVPPSGTLVRAETGSKLVALVRSDGVALQPVRVFNL